MATILRQITDRVAVVVRANLPAGATFWQDRVDPVSRGEAPGVTLVWREGPVEPFSDDDDLHVLELDLQLHVRAEPFTPAAEDLHEAFHKPLVTDQTLKGLAEGIRLVEQIPQLAEADETAGLKTARYRFKYLIPQDSL
jgi:hypothetical protein